ncbi:hypothetical protein SPRG_11624 [Saprolegnia parasitica CBS 223.65]|uniref:BZIP domain-containing protein n=1 Tax=Saprolegnia parasitica (strain CBS 223.65) TaxID=695850 RepID=A0A067C2E4_SAPPC|nr:hypothetical protein SPRG_11624 [Saprolegnia parasitica CBS 223.65]KDO23310.1 hypothetical protein SPRG_11624 [Saprolegnia parasitica CBS 223.65]|eukprot:XP_012205962.1 hypothetical protein SPRG_11624 [Saprolegnia parasitica CBS 223.65]
MASCGAPDDATPPDERRGRPRSAAPSTSTNSDDDDDDAQVRKGKQRSAYYRHKDKRRSELEYLQDKVAALEEHVRVLHETNELCAIMDPPSLWEQLAKRERKRRLAALRENERLKASLEEQVKFAKSLAAIVRKRPRLSLFADTEASLQGEAMVLCADLPSRQRMCHAISDATRAVLESAFVEAHLIDPTDPMRAHRAVLLHGVVQVHTILHMRLTVPLEAVVRVAWDILRGAYPVRSLDGTYELKEEIDEHTSYVHSERRYAVGAMVRRVVMRRYVESPSHVTIVGRSVTQDALYPVDARISDEASWMTFEATAPNETVVKYFQKSTPNFDKPLDAATIESQYLMDLYADHSYQFERAVLMLLETDGGSSSDDSVTDA